jgi:hypothetical protein
MVSDFDIRISDFLYQRVNTINFLELILSIKI